MDARDDDDAADRPAERPADKGQATEPSRAEADRPRDPRDRDGDGIPDTLRQRLEALVPEIVKKTFAAGMGAVFSTEEGIRKLAKDNLPAAAGAAAGAIAGAADGAKDKVLEVIARETREFLSTMNLTEEIAKILTTLSFEIKTEIRFIPNSERYGGVEPDVKAGVKLKRQERPPEEEREGIGSRIASRLFRRGDSDRDGERGERGPEDDADDPLDRDS